MNLLFLLLHAVSSFFLLGAVTHQALAASAPAGPGPGWWRALRAVHAERYTRAVVILFCVTTLLGAINYAPFRGVVRAEYLDAHAPWATGLFEMKEHAAALALALLPAYWAVWHLPDELAGRRWVTTILAGITWWNFLVGHIVNNVRGL